MASKLLNTYKQKIKGLTLVPSSGGCFEVTVDGDLIYSKLKTGKFPEDKWVLDTLAARIKEKGGVLV